jgi:thiol-disulfide isomerase/thioredoxin
MLCKPAIRLPWILLGAASALVLVVYTARGQLGLSRRPWLGISMAKDPAGHGVVVDHVVRGSPADRAGLKSGDRVLRVAATVVAEGADVVRAVASRAVGDAIDIVFVQGGAARTARATLTTFPSPDEMMRMDLVGAFPPAWRALHAATGVLPSSIASLRGRVVLLDFWATWCGPCRIVAPKLSALQDRYGAQGLSVVGIAAEDVPDVAAFASRTGVSYALAADSQGETTRAYGVSTLPTLLVIDKRGVVREVAIGYDPSEDAWLDSKVRSLLAEPMGP